MSLKSLSEFNAERAMQHEARRKAMEPHPNGISCPKCGVELWDSSPMMTLTSNPAQKHIHCPACEYRGYRLA